MEDGLRERPADAPADAAAAPTAADQFPCPQCGASLRYDPSADGLGCDHCGWRRDVEAAAPWARVRERDYVAALRAEAGAATAEEQRVLSCRGCGAVTTLDPLAQASECPFCATPFVDAAGARRQIAPEGVLPFAIDEREARAAMRKWLSSRWFAPNDLSERSRSGRPLSGVYLPFWTFDADTRSSYDGARGDVYYVTRTVTVTVNGRRQRRRKRVPKTRWKRVSGRVSRAFDDLLVIASRALPARFVRRFQDAAWDLSALEPYRPDFLAGFRAEVYAIDLEAGYAAACDDMDGVIRGDVRRAIGGDKQRITAVRTERSNVTFKHVLLPIWIAAYRFNDKPYRVAVNGRTGEVVGERPYSVWKVGLTAVGAVAIGGGVLYALAEAGML